MHKAAFSVLFCFLSATSFSNSLVIQHLADYAGCISTDPEIIIATVLHSFDFQPSEQDIKHSLDVLRVCARRCDNDEQCMNQVVHELRMYVERKRGTTRWNKRTCSIAGCVVATVALSFLYSYLLNKKTSNECGNALKNHVVEFQQTCDEFSHRLDTTREYAEKNDRIIIRQVAQVCAQQAQHEKHVRRLEHATDESFMRMTQHIENVREQTRDWYEEQERSRNRCLQDVMHHVLRNRDELGRVRATAHEVTHDVREMGSALVDVEHSLHRELEGVRAENRRVRERSELLEHYTQQRLADHEQRHNQTLRRQDTFAQHHTEQLDRTRARIDKQSDVMSRIGSRLGQVSGRVDQMNHGQKGFLDRTIDKVAKAGNALCSVGRGLQSINSVGEEEDGAMSLPQKILGRFLERA